MCDYCGCRELGTIDELSADHEAALHLVARLRRALAGDLGEPTAALLAELQTLLPPHLEKEEAGILAQLARDPGFAWYLGELTDDHAALRAGLLRCSPDRPEALARALDELEAHIDLEEHDLFPASRMIIDDEGWAAVSAAHTLFGAGAEPARDGRR